MITLPQLQFSVFFSRCVAQDSQTVGKSRSDVVRPAWAGFCDGQPSWLPGQDGIPDFTFAKILMTQSY